jgi:hypothetical protein
MSSKYNILYKEREKEAAEEKVKKVHKLYKLYDNGSLTSDQFKQKIKQVFIYFYLLGFKYYSW